MKYYRMEYYEMNCFVIFKDTGNYYVLRSINYTVTEQSEKIVWLYFRNGRAYKIEPVDAIIERQNLDRVVVLTPHSDDLESKVVAAMMSGRAQA